MYNNYNPYAYSNWNSMHLYDPYQMYHQYDPYLNYYWANRPGCCPVYGGGCPHLKDHGPNPFTINIEDATLGNNNFRIALWTGTHLQLTLMSIDVGSDIGLEMHSDVDQFIRIEQGEALVMMGDDKSNLNFQRRVWDDYIVLIPAGKWHNVINVGPIPLKLYSIYAPPEHPHGTVHRTKEDAERDHDH